MDVSDVWALYASRSKQKVSVTKSIMNDRCGGLVACQGKGKSTSSEHLNSSKIH
jgi:hypothetical protein